MRTELKKIDFIGIGAFKAATSSVAQLLDEHPQVCISIPKEIRYFNTYFRDHKFNDFNKMSLDWYYSHFQHCKAGSVKGEFSPNYLTDKDAPKKIFECFPDVKLILCIRNPVHRAYSDYQMLKHYTNRERLSFSNAIRTNGMYIENGLDYKHLSAFLEYFKLENISVVKFEDFKKDPIPQMTKLYKFLGVDPFFLPKIGNQKTNTAKKTRINFIRYWEYKSKRFLASHGGGKFLLFLKKKNVHKWIRNIYTKPLSYSPMAQKDNDWLKAEFAEDIIALEELLKIDLTTWK